MSICKTILEAVGNTPLVELQNLPSADDARILVKVEAVNVGGSIKTRTALNMIEAAEKEGLIHKGSVIIEPTSGNQCIENRCKTNAFLEQKLYQNCRDRYQHHSAAVVQRCIL